MLHIPFEVVDDLIPEPTEVATTVLTEVRQGIASLGNGSVEVKANISIEDNEPLLSIETVNGGSRDTINIDTTREYRAILTGDRKTEFRAKLARIGALTGVVEDETFEIVQKNAQDDYDEIEELVFPLEQDEITFGVRALAYNNLQDELEDNAAPIGVDVSYQAGRAGYAGALLKHL